MSNETDEFQYRIKRDNFKSWAILERLDIAEFDKNGKPNKNAGIKWIPFKYPGNLLQAAQGLIQLGLSDDEDYDNFKELTEAVQKAEQNILDAIEKWDRSVYGDSRGEIE